MQDRQINFGKAFKLDPNEIRVVTLQFTPPKDLEKRPPEGDVVVHISLKIAEEILGGFSARLFEAAKNKRMYASSHDKIFKAVLE